MGEKKKTGLRQSHLRVVKLPFRLPFRQSSLAAPSKNKK